MIHLRFILIILACISATRAAAAPHLSIDLDTGRVISHKQAFDPWHPASLTKLMTAYVVFRAIGAQEITGDQPVRISKQARRQPPSKMGYAVGTTVSMNDALKMLLVKSANDVSVAIGESLSGSTAAFVQRMNREATRLGMSSSRFANPHGLHDRRQITTARDMALLVRALHREFPQYRAMFSTASLIAPKRNSKGKLIQRRHYSYNLLLERYRGADGFKTGFVCASGYNFIGAATRSDRRIAAIVLGRDSQTSRAVDAAKLITEAFRFDDNAGIPLEALQPDGQVASNPRNLRSQLCTPEARAKRYEPGAGLAVIDSPWLEKRAVDQSPLRVSLLARTNRPIRVPLPSFRPNREPVGDLIISQKSDFPLPTFRPGT